jgi:hypothetical protein
MIRAPVGRPPRASLTALRSSSVGRTAARALRAGTRTGDRRPPSLLQPPTLDEVALATMTIATVTVAGHASAVRPPHTTHTGVAMGVRSPRTARVARQDRCPMAEVARWTPLNQSGTEAAALCIERAAEAAGALKIVGGAATSGGTAAAAAAVAAEVGMGSAGGAGKVMKTTSTGVGTGTGWSSRGHVTTATSGHARIGAALALDHARLGPPKLGFPGRHRQ